MKPLKSIEQLTNSFSLLPGVGHKSAEKMAYSVLTMTEEQANEFSQEILRVKREIKQCKKCGNYCEGDFCEICQDESRNKQKIIVVSSPKDIEAFERLNDFDGVYHSLNGVISAIKGIGIEDLNVESLFNRIKQDDVKEIILATNSTLEGETTGLYLAKLLEKYDIVVSRLAYGLPVGAHLEYADTLTLSKALEGRKKI